MTEVRKTDKEALVNYAGEAYAEAFIRWLREASKVAHYPLSFTVGKKYIRIVDNMGNGQRSAYGFVDREGNVLKASTWARPAKHARGSIFNEDKPADGAGKWSVLYMEDLK